MVARREGDDAASPSVGIETRERVVAAAELEGASALQVLALEEHGRAGFRVDRARRGDKRLVGDAGDLLSRGLDVCERWQRSREHYFSFPSNSSYTFRIAIGPCDFASVHDAYSPKFACLIASSSGTPALCRRVASAITASIAL